MSAREFSLAEVDYDPFAESAALARAVPVTEPQREVWLADRLGAEASLAYNESVSLRLLGPLDAQALAQAVQALPERHEALRATLSADGDQLLIAAAMALPLPLHDLSGLSPQPRAAALRALCDEAVTETFALEQGPLVRARLVRMAAQEHVLVLTAHHIVCDGWSFGVLVSDLARLYGQALDKLALAPEPAASFADYALAQQAAVNTAEAHWLGQFAGGVPTLDLPCDRPRPRMRSTRAHRVDHELDEALVAGLRKLGAQEGASLFATLYTLVATLLRRLSGQSDLVLGIAAAGQSQDGWQQLVGHCVNLLPVRTDAAEEEAFDVVLRRTRSALLDAFDHQQFTFGTLLKKLAMARDPSRLPVVSVLFNLDQRLDESSVRFPGLRFELWANARQQENFELFINAVPVGGALRLEAQYNRDLFDEASVRRWLQALQALGQAAVAAPSTAWARLGWLSGELQAEAQALQPPRTAYDRHTLVHQRMAAHAQREPTRVALAFGQQQLSYAELRQRAGAVAAALGRRGVRTGDRVGLCLLREPDLYAAVFGVLEAGAAFVPLDPAYPRERLNFMVADAGLACVISKVDVVTRLDVPREQALLLDQDLDTGHWQQPAAPVQPAPGPQTPAYVIYTSGSTGKPKGVVVPHGSLLNLLDSMALRPGLGPQDRLVAVTTMSFDMSIPELFLPLSVGARVVVASRDDARDGQSMRQLLADSGATMMQATPSGWRILLDAGWQGAPTFKALAGGEPVPADLAQALLQRCGEVWNMYGPTETTVWSTCARLGDLSQGVSIGTPLANTSVWVLDAHGQPCPLGVPGEIWIGGDGVTLGYLNRPELTQERFVADRFASAAGAQLYRTGDRGRWRNDGQLEHLGRLDFQVKLRGYRIELGEIEATLAAHAQVERCVVVTREDRPGDVRLVAYVVPSAGTAPEGASLLEYLRTRLPAYMVPQQVVPLAAIPLSPNGKIDRKALPAPDLGPAGKEAHLAPRTPTEALVLASMEEVLNLPGLALRDDFFAMGGHSLLAARLATRLNAAFDVNLPLRSFFEATTAEQLAAAVDAAVGAGSAPRVQLARQAEQASGPLSVMQQRVLFMEQLHPGRTVYNTPSAHRLAGPMDLGAFERAWRTLLQRQPSLRTQMAGDGAAAMQHVVPALVWSLAVHDLTVVPAEQREAQLAQRMAAIIETPIDLARAPLAHTAMFRLAPQEHVFLFVPHHIVWDGWSFDLLYQDLSALYAAESAGVAPRLQPLAVSYLDFVQWQRQWLESPQAQAQLTFWKQRFAALGQVRPLPTDHPRVSGMTGRGAALWVHVPGELTERLRAVARRADATLNMLALSLYAGLLSEAVGGGPLVMGIPVRGRPAAELEPLMGFFNNLLPAQLSCEPALPLLAWVARVKHEMLELFANQDLPFERLAAEPEVAAHASRAGLYHALFSFQDSRERPRQWGALAHSSVLVMQQGATEDFGLWLMEVPGGLEGGINYNADLYDAATAQIWHDRLLGLLVRAADQPDATVGELLSHPAPDRERFVAWVQSAQARAAAPAVAPAPAPAPTAGSAPPSEAQAWLAALWAELLGVPAAQIHADDNFFDLGGSSLLVMRAVALTEQQRGVSVAPNRYAIESLSALAAGLARPPAGATSGGTQAGLAELWSQLLGVPVSQISAQDNFFDLGGSSLLAMQCVQQAQAKLGLLLVPQGLLTQSLSQLATADATAPAQMAAVPAQPAAQGVLSRVLRRFGRGA